MYLLKRLVAVAAVARYGDLARLEYWYCVDVGDHVENVLVGTVCRLTVLFLDGVLVARVDLMNLLLLLMMILLMMLMIMTLIAGRIVAEFVIQVMIRVLRHDRLSI